MKTNVLEEFKQLNVLLESCFKAERKYFNAGEDTQVTAFKRFLNHESVNRNRYATKIANLLSQENIAPGRLYISKGNLHRTAEAIKQALTARLTEYDINDCIALDTEIIKGINIHLDSNMLSATVMEMLTTMKNEILQSNIALKKMQFEEEARIKEGRKTKVRVLRAM